MVDSFTIRNFRSFNEIEVNHCRRVNVIVGDNGSGKTALLEALFLAAGVSPELVLRTRSWRGFGDGQLQGTIEYLHRELWSDLFYKFETRKLASVSLKGAGEQTRSVSVKFNPRGQMKVVAPRRDQPRAPVRVIPEESPIEFRWKIRGLPDVTIHPGFQDGRVVFPDVPDAAVRAVFFAANRTPPTFEAVNRFSGLSKSFQDMEFSEHFSHLFSEIKSLSIEIGAGAPMLFASVESMPQKIPLSLASGGMSKLATILLAMHDQSGGLILVDEIENGIYHARLPLVWNALLDFARQYDCQLFISTHSAECLNAVASLAEKNPDEFCMLRTVRESDGTKVRRFDGARFAGAILSNVEVR